MEQVRVEAMAVKGAIPVKMRNQKKLIVGGPVDLRKLGHL